MVGIVRGYLDDCESFRRKVYGSLFDSQTDLYIYRRMCCHVGFVEVALTEAAYVRLRYAHLLWRDDSPDAQKMLSTGVVQKAPTAIRKAAL
ncbi:hypothetical protein JTB14_033091 [Gonioctena quinquepunctata]|nr:hypothetical protein JTB14_033091 [Gonioctena quinquepunctata]